MIELEWIVTPSLTPESQRILRVMVHKPVITGGELMVLAKLTPEQMASAVRPLVSAGIISTNTSGEDLSEMVSSYYNLNPSARQFAEFAAR